jgi:hypothetical protein
MITADYEQPRAGDGERFVDSVSLDFCDSEHDLFGLVWITRFPNAVLTRANALVFARGEVAERIEREDEQAIASWERVQVNGISMSTVKALERWSLDVAGTSASLKLEAVALSPASELSGAVTDSTGVSQYEQLCRLDGLVTIGELAHPVSCTGRRVHAWGDFAWGGIDRWRTLYAASESGRAITVAAALPAGGSGHGDELSAASLIAEDEVQPFEDVRISTVWSDAGLPAKAGLELGMPGDEIPRRMGGRAICATRTERDGHATSHTFFRWSLEGVPACGLYEVVERR